MVRDRLLPKYREASIACSLMVTAINQEGGGGRGLAQTLLFIAFRPIKVVRNIEDTLHLVSLLQLPVVNMSSEFQIVSDIIFI